MIRVASVQTNPAMNAVRDNVEAMVATMGDLARDRVQLAVFPELATTGYMFTDAEECRTVAEEIPTGPTTERLLLACAEYDMHLVFGIAEKDGDRLYNSSVLLGPTGYIGKYRKLHLWNKENIIFSPGDLGLAVHETTLGKLGILICYDLWFPEAARTLALDGAEILCVPTNWVPIAAGDGPDGSAMATVLCSAAAHCNGIPMVAADRCGTERGQDFLGRSVITSHTGWTAAGPAPTLTEHVLVADLDTAAIGPGREWNDFNNPIADRRTDSYRISD
jgi:N-carbamoylputrescine amidase